MPAKKTKKKTNQVIPSPKDAIVGINFDDMNDGEYFIMNEKLHLKIEEFGGLDQPAVDLLSGYIVDGLCDENVIPVVVTISWETK